MEENGSPQRLRGNEGYNRLNTLEMENQGNATTTGEYVAQYFFDVQQQMESACQAIDWDRVFMTAFVTISLFLILSALFFPFFKSQLVAERKSQHEFVLDSLTISEFQASPAQVTGKCDVLLNISNLGDRSLYHENAVLTIFLDHELLWVIRTGDFFLEVGSKIMFNVSTNTTTVSVPASFVPTALLESQKIHRPLHFKLKYDGMLREGMDAWHVERSHVYVVCGWIKMQFVSDSTLMGGPASCSLENF
ncbi:hypothetical protein Salat_1961600 [Sesamum alatum]|uniref:Late embryogenesis abundant protein LEA-2 subgroup domain-containing protein n=1 Tax=Sesamum alatum TaxID=300844 RepID=A0AAE1Y5F2_9LAMI|nr:hypothetical protein Salat_1961600 [Sesamum alatum]